jgi:ParB family chromosome partitioning protein
MVQAAGAGTDPMTHTDTPVAAIPAQIVVPFCDLGIAPENLRAREPADDGIPQLAETIAVADVLVPLCVRPGGKGEKPYMALDGRRRLLGLAHLLAAGRIEPAHRVRCDVFVSQAAQAAAVVLTNAERAPIHVADVISAIGKLRKRKMDSAAIAAALGYDELEIRRLSALAGLHPKALKALRQGKINLKHARQLARLTDAKEQGDIAQTALDGHFLEWALASRLERGRTLATDPRVVLVGLDRYVASGGRVDSDLFGELPDVLLDPERLDDLWRGRLQPIAAALEAGGLAVFIGAERGYRAPDGYCGLPYVHPGELAEDIATAYDAARQAAAQAVEALGASDLAAEDAPSTILAVLQARMDLARWTLVRATLGAVILYPDADTGVGATFFAHPVEEDETQDGDDEEIASEGGEFSGREGRQLPHEDIVIPASAVDVEGASHILHETRTDVATRGLIRDLADSPSVALTVVIAQLFKQLVLTPSLGAHGAALAISATGYARGRTPAMPTLDGQIRDRLEARRAGYKASGLRPIPWVQGLADSERLALLAELVALTLNLREDRTSAVRHGARAEAAEIAGLCGADIAAHWSPDAGYLTVHSKAQLLALLGEMGVEDARARTLKEDELVGLVAEAAAERQWAPAALRWDAPIAAAAPEPDDLPAASDAPTDQLAA